MSFNTNRYLLSCSNQSWALLEFLCLLQIFTYEIKGYFSFYNSSEDSHEGVDAVPGLLQFLDFIQHKNNRTYWKQVLQLLHEPVLKFSDAARLTVIFHSQTEKFETSYCGPTVFLRRLAGCCNMEIWLHQKTSMVYKVPLVPSSGRMKDNKAADHPLLYCTITHGSLGYNTTTVLNLTVLHFSKWHRGSEPWIPKYLLWNALLCSQLS